jgi:phosphate transport system substrate-binding protein
MIRTKFLRAASAVALVAMLSSVAAPSLAMAGTVRLAGSTSLQPLAQLWATAYHKAHPGTSVTVAAGGSGAGFSSAKAGSVNFGMSSKTKADSDSAAQLTPVARDAVGVIVNPKNNVQVLTPAYIKGIYTGKYKTWAQVGGKSRAGFNANHAIVLDGRTGASGTYDYFKTALLGGTNQSSKTKQYASNGMVRSAVARDPYGIGYVSIAYINKTVKGIRIAPAAGKAAVAPTQALARSGKYPYVRYLYFVNYASHPVAAGSEADLFRKYCLSSAGQKIAAAENLPVR